MMRSKIKLQSLLDLYNPAKYSLEVCKAKEEMWTEKIEKSFLEHQEDYYRYQDYADSISHPENGLWDDESLSSITEAVSQYMVEMSFRAFYSSSNNDSALGNANNGVGDVYNKTKGHSMEEKVKAYIMKQYETRPGLGKVDSYTNITNIPVPSDAIIDTFKPNIIPDSGQVWNKDDKIEEVMCVIPDKSYPGVYDAVVKNCQAKGQLDYTTNGHVSNVDLVDQKAEEYGDNDKTFEISSEGTITVTNSAGNKIFEHAVEIGDIWRMCKVKDIPIQDWVKLAVSRARATGAKAVFWLDAKRAHDANLIGLVKKYLGDHDTTGIDIEFLKPADACTVACDRAREGLDTITCTGNVLMDSLSEYLTTVIRFTELGDWTNNVKSQFLGETFMNAVGKWLDNNRSPSSKVKQIDIQGMLRDSPGGVSVSSGSGGGPGPGRSYSSTKIWNTVGQIESVTRSKDCAVRRVKDEEQRDVIFCVEILFLGGVIMFLHARLINVVKIIIVGYVILLIRVVMLIQCGVVKVIQKGIVKISNPKYTDRAVWSLVKLSSVEDSYFIENMSEVEKNIKEMDRRVYQVNHIVPNVAQRCEDGSYSVNLVQNNDCSKACCCVGHCGNNHYKRMKTLSQLLRGDPRVSGVTGAVVCPDVVPDDGHDPLDVGLLPLDVKDEVWSILTALETKFSLE